MEGNIRDMKPRAWHRPAVKRRLVPPAPNAEQSAIQRRRDEARRKARELARDMERLLTQ